MSEDDGDFRIRPGKVRDRGAGGQRLAAQVRRAAARTGHLRRGPTGSRGTGSLGRGRIARLRTAGRAGNRRVVVKARVVRHKGARFRAAPLSRHIAYLQREGVTRDGRDAQLFDAGSDLVEPDAFARRCEDDRHHFRFIVSPEDAAELADLRTFTRELMQDVASDLGTRIDWVAVDHWNTDNPHVHVLVRGTDETGADLVIDRDYIREGMRARAESRATLELGPRSEREIRSALEREVEADRWTSLDLRLRRMADELGGVIDLRPQHGDDPHMRGLLLGRADKLERLGLIGREGSARWSLKPGAEQVLRDLAIRTDIIKTMHRAVTGSGRVPDLGGFALHGELPGDPVLGRLVERGLHDELAGTAYAVVDGLDGRTHHLRFADIDMTGDAKPGAIVELRTWPDMRGHTRLSLATRSDLSLKEQVGAPGATWLDRQLVARQQLPGGNGFGLEYREALDARGRHLEAAGLARRQGSGYRFADDLVQTLRGRELEASAATIASRSGLAHQPSQPGDHVAGIYRERVSLASGRFAMIDDGLGFQLVPWRPALDAQLGRHVSGTMGPGGAVDWSLGRARGPAL
jgi:type IV secretory pathway VirD2 relaxase